MGVLSVRVVASTAALALCMCCCSRKNYTKAEPSRPTPQTDSGSVLLAISIQIFRNDTLPGSEKSDGYGYDIFIGKDRYIRQQYIPAIPGHMAFSTPAKAYKTASLIANKIRQHILPPTVSVGELDSMGVL